MVKDYFAACEEQLPENKSALRRISVALRRDGVLTMESLCQMQRETPEKLVKIRGIGTKSIGLIAELCRQYENK